MKSSNSAASVYRDESINSKPDFCWEMIVTFLRLEQYNKHRLARTHAPMYGSHHVHSKACAQTRMHTNTVGYSLRARTSTMHVQLSNRQHIVQVKVKVWFYIALYSVHWTAQSALHFPPLAYLFIPTPFSASLGSILAMQQLRNDYALTFPPLSIARYSFIQLSRLRRREVKENAQTSNSGADKMHFWGESCKL